jgi:endoplasmic reticulum lectin 1
VFFFLLLACEEAGNENIVGFEEVSSCVYEMIVVSRIICDHPAYKLPEKSKKAINCYSADPAQQQSKPRELEQFEEARDSLLKQAQNRIRMTNRDGDTFIIHYKTIDTNEEANNDDVAAAEPDEQQQQQTATPPNQPYTPPPPHQAQATISDEAEREVIQSFISGVSCLTGGLGWWKYEVCIGRQVNQFHEDETTKKRQSIRLGSWNKNDHLEWLRSHPNKRPLTNVNDRTTVTHYFSNGDRCEENNRSRFVELKLKCIRTREKSHAVSLYLMEPATCEYILTIESPWLCEYVESADMNGLANVFYAEDSTGNNPTVVP